MNVFQFIEIDQNNWLKNTLKFLHKYIKNVYLSMYKVIHNASVG